MSMEISSNYKDYKNEYLDRVQTGQDKVKESSQDQRGGRIKTKVFPFQRTSILVAKNLVASQVVCIV